MKQLLTLAFFFLIATAPQILFGQPTDPEPVPIDGGMGFLAAAGVAYGVKKYRDMKKNK